MILSNPKTEIFRPEEQTSKADRRKCKSVNTAPRARGRCFYKAQTIEQVNRETLFFSAVKDFTGQVNGPLPESRKAFTVSKG